jgi:hypothetical protein
MRAALAAALVIGLSAGSSACTASSYAGIPLGAGAADPDLQSLARRARAGDRSAQLELGSRYEHGRGVVRDPARAAALYRRAAAGTTGAQQVYLPPVGKHGQGRVVRIDRSARNQVSGDAHMRRIRPKSDESAAAKGTGCSGLACSTGGVAPAPPIASSLAPGEVWRRLLETVLRGVDLGPDDAARIFGVPAAAIRQSAGAKVYLEFNDASVRLFSFALVRRSCPGGWGDLCAAPGSLTELSVTYLADPAEPACIRNNALSERFVQAGWVEPKRERVRIDPRTAPIDSGVRAFDIFVRPGAKAHLTPSTHDGELCLSQLLYLVRASEEK